MPEFPSRRDYEAECSRHALSVADALQQIDAAIREVGVAGNVDELARLKTKRVVLASGLFDADFYRSKYPGIGNADPLDHYVNGGDAENRQPNRFFYTRYYRLNHMNGVSPDSNALQHYVEVGERSGGKPNIAFDPQEYLVANGLADCADRPLFHFLRIGQDKKYAVALGIAKSGLKALDYADKVHEQELQFELLDAKRAIIDELGIADGYALYRRIVRRRDHGSLRLMSAERLEEAAPKRAAFFHQIDPGGEPFTILPPKVVGRSNGRALHGHLRPSFVACFADARVRTGCNTIEVDEAILFPDEEVDRNPSVFATLDAEGWVQTEKQGSLWVLTPRDGEPETEIEEAFSLLGLFAYHFGHWMVQFLPKYVAALMSGALPRVPVLIDAKTHANLRQALELMLPAGTTIITLPQFATARVRRLWCASDLTYISAFQRYTDEYDELAAFPAERYRPVIHEMARRVHRSAAPVTGPERIYLARRPTYRALLNRIEIEEVARQRGFVIVYPEDLSFIEQASLMRNARYVVGPDGSAMFLAFCAPAGAKVCDLIGEAGVVAVQTDFCGPFSGAELDLTVFTGQCVGKTDYEFNRNYEIDREAFSAFLDEWLEK